MQKGNSILNFEVWTLPLTFLSLPHVLTLVVISLPLSNNNGFQNSYSLSQQKKPVTQQRNWKENTISLTISGPLFWGDFLYPISCQPVSTSKKCSFKMKILKYIKENMSKWLSLNDWYQWAPNCFLTKPETRRNVAQTRNQGRYQVSILRLPTECCKLWQSPAELTFKR